MLLVKPNQLTPLVNGNDLRPRFHLGLRCELPQARWNPCLMGLRNSSLQNLDLASRCFQLRKILGFHDSFSSANDSFAISASKSSKLVPGYEIFGAEMRIGSISLNPRILILVLVTTILNRVCLDSVSALCEFSVKDKNKLYNYSLAAPLRKFPHGILSEDGFYKVSANGTVLWFQLCGSMIFNHDPPMCFGCKDCGGSSRCGMGCSALVSNKMEGYPVCTTLGHSSTMLMDVIDRKSLHTGIIVKMTNNGPKHNCSLSVAVICKSNGIQAPQTFETVGFCDYTTELKHPSGCAKILSSHGNGLGWFGTLIIIILCLFGVYLLAGAVYRYYFLRIRGIDVIPNLEFWTSLPNRVQSLYHSLVRRFRGPSVGHRSSYSPVNF